MINNMPNAFLTYKSVYGNDHQKIDKQLERNMNAQKEFKRLLKYNPDKEIERNIHQQIGDIEQINQLLLEYRNQC